MTRSLPGSCSTWKRNDWQCAVCLHPDSYADPSSYLGSGALELTFIDPEESHPDAESTRIENPEESQPYVESQYSNDHEESSLHDLTPAETSSSFAVTYEIVTNVNVL